MQPDTVWTIGHSTRPLAEFTALLESERIELLADVRRYPASRMHPHFNAEALARSLLSSGIRYEAFGDLGGRRPPRPDSPNTRWRNASFRGYADYMETPEFGAAFARLRDHAAKARTAIMCAEALWWRCHRALIADALKVLGVEVLHILGDGKKVEHPYTSAVSIAGGKLSYGPSAGLFG
jgi:uncharacterized protein (DUF488 family)